MNLAGQAANVAAMAFPAASIRFPKRLGKPEEVMRRCAAIVENMALNGEAIRLAGALRSAPG